MARLSSVCCLVLLALGHADPSCASDDDVSSLLQVDQWPYKPPSAFEQMQWKVEHKVANKVAEVKNEVRMAKFVTQGVIAGKVVQHNVNKAVEKGVEHFNGEAEKVWRQGIHQQGTEADQARKASHKETQRVLKEEAQKRQAVHQGQKFAKKAIHADDKFKRQVSNAEKRALNKQIVPATEKIIKGAEKMLHTVHHNTIKAAHAAENENAENQRLNQKQTAQAQKGAIKTGEKNLTNAMDAQKLRIEGLGQDARKNFGEGAVNFTAALDKHNQDVQDWLQVPKDARKSLANATAQAEAAAVSPEGRQAAREAAIRIKDQSIAEAQAMYDGALKVQEEAIKQQATMIAEQRAKTQAKADAQSALMRAIGAQSSDED